jgi:hypothetical protein
MKKKTLKPGDIVKDPSIGLGMVMRNEEPELLIAFPGMEEFSVYLYTSKEFELLERVGKIKHFEE